MTIVEEPSLPNRNSNLKAQAFDNEHSYEKTIRPVNFSEYVGQKKHVENLKIMANAAKSRNEAMDHCLLLGPPGLGKTTLAHIIAQEMGKKLFVTSGPALEKKGDLAGILTNLNHGDVFFIDEIHRLNASIEENIYPAMEDFKLDIIIGEGAHARVMPLKLEKFTLVGATTKTGLITSPLRDRFGFFARLEFYEASDLIKIITRAANILGITIQEEAALHIAQRSRGTPRIANRLLRRVRDFAQVLNDGVIDTQITQKALSSLDIDEQGFDAMDKKILTLLCHQSKPKPMGLETIAASLNESSSSIEEVYEPFLIQQGYLTRTPRGRMATKKAFDYLGISYSHQEVFL